MPPTLCRIDRAWLMAALLAASLPGSPAGAQTITLQSSAGGVHVTGANPSWRAGFGPVNGLGIGTPGAGITVFDSGVTGGVLYVTPITMTIAGGRPAQVSAFASDAFSHPSALELRLCRIGGSCASPGDYVTLSASAGAPTPVTSGNTSPGAYTFSLGVFVRDVNGAGAFTGTDVATVTLRTTRAGSGQETDTDTLTLDSPGVQVQTAVRLRLDSGTGGLSIDPGADAVMHFGSVNGLGIGPSPGVTVSPTSGGMLYSTPYRLRPTFTGFSSTMATALVHVGTDFAHPAIVELRESSNGVSFSPVAKGPSGTAISTTIATGAPVTRHLGLFVADTNGPTAHSGSDTAVLTYTLVVP